MNDRQQVRNLIKRSRAAAASQMNALKAAKRLDSPTVDGYLRSYILHKYLLTEEELPKGEIFADIVQASLAKSMKVSKDLVEQFDRAQSCDGTTSAMAKKILLIMAIQRELGITLDETACARIGTLSDFTQLVFDTMAKTAQWNSIIQHE